MTNSFFIHADHSDTNSKSFISDLQHWYLEQISFNIELHEYV